MDNCILECQQGCNQNTCCGQTNQNVTTNEENRNALVNLNQQVKVLNSNKVDSTANPESNKPEVNIIIEEK